MKKFERLMAEVEAKAEALRLVSEQREAEATTQKVVRRVEERIAKFGDVRGGHLHTPTRYVKWADLVTPPVNDSKPQPKFNQVVPQIDVAAIEREVFGT